MASWGLLAGLGQGLQQAGQMWDAQRKEKLAQELELAREKRAEQRQLAKEEREAKRLDETVASYKPVVDDNGTVWMQGFNSAGAPRGERRAASQTEIEDFNRQRDKDRLSLDKLVAEADTAKFKAGRLSTEAGQDDELFGLRKRQLEASISETQAQAAERRANAARRTSDKDTDKNEGPVPLSDLAESMVSEYSDMFEQYGLSHSDSLEVARAAINTARREGKDPVDVARRALPAYDKWRQGRKKSSTKVSISD